MGLLDVFDRIKRDAQMEAMDMAALFKRHQADVQAEAVDASELPNGVGPFGLVVTNPIPTQSVLSSIDYLSRLKTLRGVRPEIQRVGSTIAKGITHGVIDMYVVSAEGQDVMLYLCPYHKRTSNKAPDGFILDQD